MLNLTRFFQDKRMKVLVVFFALACLFGAWRITPHTERKAAKKAIQPFVLPVLLAAIVTVCVLAFAFNFNGKLI